MVKSSNTSSNGKVLKMEQKLCFLWGLKIPGEENIYLNALSRPFSISLWLSSKVPAETCMDSLLLFPCYSAGVETHGAFDQCKIRSIILVLGGWFCHSLLTSVSTVCKIYFPLLQHQVLEAWFSVLFVSTPPKTKPKSFSCFIGYFISSYYFFSSEK